MTKHDQPTGCDFNKVIGARLKAMRRYLGYSQQEMADAFGLSLSTLKKYERGAHVIGPRFLFDLNNDPATRLMSKALMLPIYNTTVNKFYDALLGMLRGKLSIYEIQPKSEVADEK